MLYNLIKINFIDRVMIVKYLSYSLGYRLFFIVRKKNEKFFVIFYINNKDFDKLKYYVIIITK